MRTRSSSASVIQIFWPLLELSEDHQTRSSRAGKVTTTQQTHNPPDAQQQSHNDETRIHRIVVRRPRMLKYTSRLLPLSLKCACGYAPRARVRSSSPSLSSNQKNESALKIAQKTLLTDAHSHVHATRRRRCTSPCAKRRVCVWTCLRVSSRALTARESRCRSPSPAPGGAVEQTKIKFLSRRAAADGIFAFTRE